MVKASNVVARKGRLSAVRGTPMVWVYVELEEAPVPYDGLEPIQQPVFVPFDPRLARREESVQERRDSGIMLK